MKINFRQVFVFGLILFVMNSIKAEPQKFVVSLDTSSIRVGEQVHLKLNVALPKSATIFWPVIADTLTAKVEVAKRSKVDTSATSNKDYINYTQNITVTSFDTGYHYIPPFAVHYSTSGDSTKHELLSESLFLKVRTVEVDTTRAIRDIRGTMNAPITFAELAQQR